MVLRLVLAEDSLLMREGIAGLLALDDELELVASCESYEQLLEAVDGHRPDAAGEIRADHPGKGAGRDGIGP